MLRPCGIQRFEWLGYPTVWHAWMMGMSVTMAQQACCLQEGHEGPHEFVPAERAREAWERKEG